MMEKTRWGHLLIDCMRFNDGAAGEKQCFVRVCYLFSMMFALKISDVLHIASTYGIVAEVSGNDMVLPSVPSWPMHVSWSLVHDLVRFLPALWMRPTCSAKVHVQTFCSETSIPSFSPQLCLVMFWWGTLPSGNTTWWPRDLVSFLKSDHHPSCLLSLWHSPFWGICIYINLSSLLSRGCSVRSGIRIFHADGPSAPPRLCA